MNRRGFTLVEALVGVAILQIGIFAAIFLTKDISVRNKGVSDDLTYQTYRNQIIIALTDPRTWAYTLVGAKNPGLSCWVKQDSEVLADRNCVARQGDLVVYDIKGNPEFDFTEPTAGLDPRGIKCTTYVPAPGTPNAQCPLGVRLTWAAVCEIGDPECVNPPIKVMATFTFNGDRNQSAPPAYRLNFTTFRYLRFCPTQPPGGVLQDGGVAPAVTIVNNNQVISGQSGQVVTTGFGEMSVPYVPCRTVSINYQDDMDSIPASPAIISDPQNESVLCLYDKEAAQCRFEVARRVVGTVPTIFLRYGGADLTQVPAYANVKSTSALNLRITRNLVEFLVDGKVYYTWPQKLTFPPRIHFKPPSRTYSPNGFTNISVSTFN